MDSEFAKVTRTRSFDLPVVAFAAILLGIAIGIAIAIRIGVGPGPAASPIESTAAVETAPAEVAGDSSPPAIIRPGGEGRPVRQPAHVVDSRPVESFRIPGPAPEAYSRPTIAVMRVYGGIVTGGEVDRFRAFCLSMFKDEPNYCEGQVERLRLALALYGQTADAWGAQMQEALSKLFAGVAEGPALTAFSTHCSATSCVIEWEAPHGSDGKSVADWLLSEIGRDQWMGSELALRLSDRFLLSGEEQSRAWGVVVVQKEPDSGGQGGSS